MSDPHPDSPPEADLDRTDIERDSGSLRPEPAGEPGAIGGTDGMTKNQDRDAQ